MSKTLTTALLFAAVATATAFAAAPTDPAETTLPVVHSHEDHVGDRFVIRSANGRDNVIKIVEVADGVTTWRHSASGCRFSRHTEGFGPSLQWWNCGGADGTTSVERTGSVFPMRVGAREEWAYTSRNDNGAEWWSTRRCDVENRTRVSVPAGAFDAYRIVCEDDWSVAEFFYAPAVRQYVRFRKTWKEPGLGANQDDRLVAFTPAQ